MKPGTVIGIVAVILAGTAGWFAGEWAQKWNEPDKEVRLGAVLGSEPVDIAKSTQQGAILQQAKQVAAMTGQFERSVRLLALVEHATPDTLRRLMLQFSDDESLQQIVAIRWAEIDPRGMAAFVDNGPNHFGYTIEQALFSTWAASDPDVAWDYAGANQGGMDYGERGILIMEELVRTDIATAMRLLGKNPDLIHGDATWEWEGNDLGRAVRMLADSPDGFLRSNSLSDLVADWVDQEPAAAIKWLQDTDNGEKLSDYIFSIASNLVAKDMALAQQLFRDSESPEVRTSLGRNIASEIAKTDPLIAVEWAEKELSGSEVDNAIASIAYEVASSDPLLALEMYERLPRGECYRSLARNITSQLWKSDPESALQWATSLEQPEEQKDAVSAIRDAVFYGQSPEAAAALLSAHPDNAVLKPIAEEFAGKYSGADGIEWARKLPPAHAEALTRKLFENWAGNSPQTAADYLQSGAIPADLRAPAVSTLARRWFGQSPEQATAWAVESIANSPAPDADRLAIVRAIRVANLPEAQKSTAQQLIGGSSHPSALAK